MNQAPGTVGGAIVGRRLRRPLGLRFLGQGVPWIERIAVVVAVLMILLAIFGPIIAPQSPDAVNPAIGLQGPSGAHLFGTDILGRDVFSRVLAGARLTLLTTFAVLAISAVIGIAIGTVSALGGRVLDEIIMRICDIGLALPSIVLAMGLAAALGPSLRSAAIAMIATWWPGYARLVRTIVREIRHADFVESAVALGVSRRRLIFRHILPNVMSTMYVQLTLDVAAVMIVISGLSFIGVGAQAPSPEWGAMIAASTDNLTSAWWTMLFPGLGIAITAIAFNLSGDWVRVRTDPTLKGR
jgi:peptide/nickel transport system permease protein